jgi:NodT family efflux transporter outer membrane factor (OMF) lipoprotein
MRRNLLLLVAILLAGCAGPRSSTPREASVEPPPTWRTAVVPDGDLSARWWQSFGDPGLTAVVEAALARNEDIRIAAARIEELASLSALAHAQRMPEVDGSVVYQRDRTVNPAYGTPDTENVTEPVIAFSYDADLFGRLRAADAAARADLLATRAAQADVQLVVAALAARAWFTLRSLDDRLDILRQTVVVREQTLKLVRRRVSVGYATQLDLAQAEAEYRATLQLVPVTELAISHTENALSVLLGQSPRAIERSIAMPTLPSIPQGLPSSLLRRRPDIVEAEEHLVAADRRLDASRAAFMPDLRLHADWGHVTSTIIPSPIDVFAIGAGVFAPIFDAGRLKAGQDAAAARRDAAAWAYRKAALEAFAEVDDALAATQRTREQLEALEAQQLALERTLKVASKRYKAGYAPFLDQLDAQRGLLSVQLATSQVRAEQRSAFVTLFQALGGGWDVAALKTVGAK